MDSIQLRHPYWIRIIGWVFLPVMFCLAIWCLFLPVWYERYDIAMFLAATLLGGGNLYMTTHGLRTLPFMNSVITLTDNEITVLKGKQTTSISWQNISKARHVASTQVLHLFDSEGKRFLSVTEQLKGFHLLESYLNVKSGLKI